MELCRATEDKTKYLDIKLADVHIASAQPTGQPKGGDAVPSESVAFNFGKIEYTYYATDHKTGKPAGQVAMNWSTVENKGG
jgi:type VI secretion system secreted protein Hcp